LRCATVRRVQLTLPVSAWHAGQFNESDECLEDMDGASQALEIKQVVCERFATSFVRDEIPSLLKM
jgi:hypothetical protein